MNKTPIKPEPIYEKLAIGEALIISRDENNCYLVAENRIGLVTLRIAKITDETVVDLYGCIGAAAIATLETFITENVKQQLHQKTEGEGEGER